jgi:hypothetical protein
MRSSLGLDPSGVRLEYVIVRRDRWGSPDHPFGFENLPVEGTYVQVLMTFFGTPSWQSQGASHDVVSSRPLATSWRLAIIESLQEHGRVLRHPDRRVLSVV